MKVWSTNRFGLIELYSTKCSKTKTKVIKPANVNNPRGNKNIPIRTPRENNYKGTEREAPGPGVGLFSDISRTEVRIKANLNLMF